VRLDPGLAFGTGTHPTTALCLEALEGLELSGKSVLDYGCGSGILSVAALKLGAARALAVDIDPQALLASGENARRNGVAALLTTSGPGTPLPRFACVIANILATTLIDLLPVLAGACESGADLLLSGVLASQADAVAAAYAPLFSLQGTRHRDDWCCLHARRRDRAAVVGSS
jgi:ribosomal protein L11 methyltransferase